MHSSAGWADVCIHNISTRGLLLWAENAPAPGTYVDIRRGTQIVIGRTIWRKDHFFGVKAQDRIDFEAIINEPRLAGPPKSGAAKSPDAERRSAARLVEAELARKIERNRRFASVFQYGVMLVVGACAASFVGIEVYRTLSAPFVAVGEALAPHQSR